jgi:hypothetical protein
MSDKVKPFKIPQEVQAALELLLRHGRRDYGGARRCAMFLLSLWDGETFKADLQALMYCDNDIFAAMMRVYQYLYASNQQLDTLVAEDQIRPVLDAWGQAFTAAGTDG